MKTTRSLIFIAILASLSVSSSAEIYKCTINGKSSYSDKPCAANSEKLRGLSSNTSTSSIPTETPVTIGARTCASEAPRHIAFKDPGSVQIGQIIGGTMEVIKYANTAITARLFFVPINAKNSYGGYVGEKPILCYTSEDGKRVLKVNDILLK